jgi:hypothetical protein
MSNISHLATMESRNVPPRPQVQLIGMVDADPTKDSPVKAVLAGTYVIPGPPADVQVYRAGDTLTFPPFDVALQALRREEGSEKVLTDILWRVAGGIGFKGFYRLPVRTADEWRQWFQDNPV